MNERPELFWTGRFLTGKLIVPLGFALFVLQLMVPFTTIYRGLWNVFVVFPALILALGIAALSGQIVSLGSVVFYRRWFRWKAIPNGEVLAIRRVLGPISAIYLVAGGTLYGFTEPGESSLHAAASRRAIVSENNMNDTGQQRRASTLWTMSYWACGILGIIVGRLTPGNGQPSRATTENVIGIILNFQIAHMNAMALVILLGVLASLVLKKATARGAAIAYFVLGLCVAQLSFAIF